MTKLEFFNRPLVAFDPNNRQHREWFAEFMVHNTWGRCPVRFIVPEDSGLDLPGMCKDLLLEYYIKKDVPKRKLKPA
jgi:hypothetical protein